MAKHEVPDDQHPFDAKHGLPDVDPPPMLARRTCDKIWEILDEEDANLPNSGIFLDSAHFAPESVLPAQFLAETLRNAANPKEDHISNSAEQNLNEPHEDDNDDDDEDEDEESSRSLFNIGFIASTSTGILIAFLLFLVIRYAERSTTSYVTESWVNEVSRRVGQYEQIYGSLYTVPQPESTLPYNLALQSWQELNLEHLEQVFRFSHSSPFPIGLRSAWMADSDSRTCRMHSRFLKETGKVLTYSHRGQLLIAKDSAWDISFLFDGQQETGLSGYFLLIMRRQDIPIRSAFGQDILFRNGRIFSRILPLE